MLLQFRIFRTFCCRK